MLPSWDGLLEWRRELDVDLDQGCRCVAARDESVQQRSARPQIALSISWSRLRAKHWLLWAALCSGGVLQAQDRPSETDLFGGQADDRPATPETSVTPEPAARDTPGALAPAAQAEPTTSTRDDQVLGGAATPMFSQKPATTDPLTIGGQLYLRAQSNALRNQQVEDYSFTMPTLLDVYLDARPNERVRGFVLGRMSYDPMQPDSVNGVSSAGTTTADGGISGSPALSSLFGTQTNAPRILLDQLWLRFDMWHTLFVTAGRQHVRWGTARFWTPADLLHLRRRNPLDVFDARRGTDMLKLHLPIESNAWNLYAYAITTGQKDRPTLYTVAGAARAEFVAGTNELGLGALVRRGSRAKFAADLSMGLGDFDVYGEAALLDAREIDRVRFEPNATLPEPAPSAQSPTADPVLARIEQAVDAYYPTYRQHGYKPQIVGGLSYTHKYNDNDTFTLGVEYFYNGLGYSDAASYLGLLFPHTTSLDNPASFFYLGQHYAALFLVFPAPFALDLHSFTLSTLGNLSDRSFITRLDYSLQLLTHLRFEAFVAGFYGRPNGEFRFGIQTPKIDDLRLTLEPPTFNVGVALRVSI